MNPALPLAVPAFSARPLTSRRMNTCRSASKQATSSLFRIHTYAKVRGGLRVFQRGGPSPLPASKKHPGYRGLYLQTRVRKRRGPKDSHSGTRRPLPCLPASVPSSRHSPAAPRAALNDLCSLACPECISRRVADRGPLRQSFLAFPVSLPRRLLNLRRNPDVLAGLGQRDLLLVAGRWSLVTTLRYPSPAAPLGGP